MQNSKQFQPGFYRHFKGMNYFALGVAKHSETLEEYIVYETRYDNPQGKLWIRPRQMFEEVKELQGTIRPRFATHQWKTEQTAVPTSEQLNAISDIAIASFGGFDKAKLICELSENNSWLFLFAIDDHGKIIGFKYGKAKNKEEFVSCLGAVHPNYQNLGIATQLMQTQHLWARQHGYKWVHTTTKNTFPSMLRLNLKFKFQITGTTLEQGELKILMSKQLTN